MLINLDFILVCGYQTQYHIVSLFSLCNCVQDMMEALTTQNSELRTMLIKATEVKQHPESSDENGASSHRDELVCIMFYVL